MSPTQFAQIQEVFLADIKAQVVMNDIPDEMIINWDQTCVPLVPIGEWDHAPCWWQDIRALARDVIKIPNS